MKRYLLLFLLAALACSCNDSTDDNPFRTGSETQQPVSADEILPRRLVSVDVTSTGNFSYSETYAYDEQGRLTSFTNTSSSAEAYSRITNYTYTDNTIIEGKKTYNLQNGRVVSAREERDSEEDVWAETTFGYDAAGYLTSLSFLTSYDFKYDCAVTYTADGVSFKSWGDGGDETLIIEFDRERLNNLTFDFYGRFCDGPSEFDYNQARLLGICGQRLRYLPAMETTISPYEKEGQQYTDKYVYRYVYHMDGDYLAEVEIYSSYNDEPEGEPERIVFHYE